MAKMGNSRYDFKGQSYTAKELVEKQKRNKKTNAVENLMSDTALKM
jgi:hypothetical protein